MWVVPTPPSGLGGGVDRAKLAPGVRVELAIAMSGARLDLGETERALLELDIPELDPDRAFEWSPALFAARATVLEELGRTDEANEWSRRAVVAAEVLHDASGEGDLEVIEIEEVEEIETFDDAGAVDESPAQDADSTANDAADHTDETEDDGLDEADDVVLVEGIVVADGTESVTTSEISVEDEVHELLVEAGVDDDDDEEHAV